MIFGCQGGSNPLSQKKYIEINFPLNRQCVYVSLFVVQTADSIHLAGLNVFSLEFNQKTELADEIEYKGQVTSYVPPELKKSYPANILQPGNGEIDVSIKNNWVLYQFCEVNEAYNMFIKTNTDTMDLPTQFKNQFPSFPQKILAFTQYSAFRPENSGAEWGYTGVYREFNAGDFRDWSTAYSQYRGIYLSGKQELLNASIDMEMIVDDAGIVISQLSFGESVLMNEEGIPFTTADSYLVNQRLVDFSNPELIHSLSYYAYQILNSDINFVLLN